jgi:GNAT superfamily N-acetyltransferase
MSELVSLIIATEFDAERLAELSKLAFNTDVEVGAPTEGGPPGYDEPKWQTRAMKIMDYYCILLDNSIMGGVVVGSGGVEHKILERIFVDPEHHNKGIGTRAMQLTIDQYPLAKVWTLGTPEWNERTSHFYEKLGFTQVGWDNADPKFRGRWYQKILDPSYRHLKVGELRGGMGNVTVEGEILEKSQARMVRSRRRSWKRLSVADAGFGDDTGRLVLTLWNDQIKMVNVGDHVRVENGYVGSYRGVKQLSTGKAGRIIHLI